MSEKRDFVITMCLFNRPQYARQVFQALSKCRGIEKYTILPHCEPGNQAIVDLVNSVDFCECLPHFNDKRLHANSNTIAAFDRAFSMSAFLLHIEDDILLAPDALDYFEWCQHRYADEPKVLSVSGYNRVPVHGENLQAMPVAEYERQSRLGEPQPEVYHQVERRSWFIPWGFGIWRSRWVKYRAEICHEAAVDPVTNALTKYRGTGYDGGLLLMIRKYGLVEVFPSLSRVQNIGVISSIHDPKTFTPAFHRVEMHAQFWAGDGRVVEPGQWHESGTEQPRSRAELHQQFWSGDLARPLQQELSDIGPRVVAMLNQAFLADPAAIHTLMCNRVPCNEKLADDCAVIVKRTYELLGSSYAVDALGLLNGALRALDQPYVIAFKSTDYPVHFSDNGTGYSQVLGFYLQPRMDGVHAPEP